MSFEVKIMPQAELDLRGIYEYIAYTLQSPMSANGQLDRLAEQILKLDTFPTGYPAYSKEPWKTRGLRYMLIDNYIAYFIPNEETEIVSVLRVMYKGRNIEEQLNK
ncbi:MAG: type II toxin-antitoxin system RelE/ParE family toxin [Streptococcaceae bacterium]|jgi:toxin ParE1/3/4|nr:type II toxin-antitoxin system RelE/ParE family toxin [Streptococcaceae bacterium]